jgi:hypothetical protein
MLNFPNPPGVTRARPAWQEQGEQFLGSLGIAVEAPNILCRQCAKAS